MTGRILPATPENILRASEILKSGGLVAFPTETVYGLGANALDQAAVERIFTAKGRPQDNPLILHVSGIREAAKYGEMNECAETLMQQFWPGPLTIVLYSLDDVPEITRGGLDTVALRMPSNTAALSLIREAGLPVAAPSANRSGRPSPTSARTVADDLGDAVDLILDGGTTSIGLESTVVDATKPGGVTILRPGGVTREALGKVVDVLDDGGDEIEFRSPGTRYRHYAPILPVALWNGEPSALHPLIDGKRWCYIGLKKPPIVPVRAEIFGSVEEYAQQLYSKLRELETCGAELIVAESPEESGLGAALRDRLERAAGE